MPDPATRANALDHVVVVLFENRSLDNLLGRLYGPGGWQGFRGRHRQGAEQPDPRMGRTLGGSSRDAHRSMCRFLRRTGSAGRRRTKAVAPDKPFFLYYAFGADAPHHVPKEWADKYKGTFDMGYEAHRELVFENQKKLGDPPRGRGALADQPVR
jgi:arylsulfatase A-like enzyme